MRVEDTTKCKECNSRNLVEDIKRGELYCADCGSVLDEKQIERKTSGREKDGDPNSARIYEPNDPAWVLGSQVGIRNTDGSIDRTKIGRALRKENKRQLPSHVRNQQKGIVQVKMLLADLGAPLDFQKQAVWNYKRLNQLRVFNGMPLETRAAAVVYFTYRDNNILRSIEEVAEANSSHPRQVAKLSRKIASAFRRPWVLSRKNMQDEILKYCNLLKMNQNDIASILELSVPVEQMADGLYYQKGVGLTAALIYLGIRLIPNGSYRTQRDISEVCRITEVTLRNNYKLILKGLNIDKSSVDHQGLTIDDIISGAYRNEEE